VGTGWGGIRTAEAPGVQTHPTTKGRGATEEIDTYFHPELLHLPKNFIVYKKDISENV
jgi:hypothetical protein